MMGTEDKHDEGKRRIALRVGVVFAFLFALTWSLPSFLNWIFFSAAGYSFFLYWYYQPRAEMFQKTGEFEYRSVNPAERLQAMYKRVVRIIGLSISVLFTVFLVVRIFSRDDRSTTSNFEPDETETVEGDDATSLNDQGYEFYLNKQYDSALYYYNKALDLEQGNGSAWLNKGMVYYDLEQADKALDAFSRAYEAGVRDAFLSHVLGYLYDSQGNTTRALNFYKEALEMDSSRSNIYTRLAELEPSQADRYKALEEKWKN